MSAVEDLAEHLQTTTISELQSVPFNPTATALWSYIKLSPIPRYLFRVYTPRSDGRTDDRWVESRDALNGRISAREDIFQTTDPALTAELVSHHLWWSRCPREDNLTSWTSSFLFAIQYTFYRNSSAKDGSPMRDVRICVIDTRKFNPGVFIRDMDLIVAFSQHDSSLARLQGLRDAGKHYYGEYLSQGALGVEGKCQSASVQDMLDRGLLSLRLEFRDAFRNGSYGWAKAVDRSRESLNDVQQQSVSSAQVEVAIRIGCIFGPSWRLPVAVNLTALLSGRLDFNVIERTFRNVRVFDSTYFNSSISRSPPLLTQFCFRLPRGRIRRMRPALNQRGNV